ncbi:MAG: HU family DNA-binding protein [Candidatus Methylomirabilia bacterium]
MTTKTDLVAGVAKASGGTKVAAERGINALLGAIRDSLKRGRRVTLVGFGTFSTSRRAARNGRNPRTGKAIRIPSVRVPRFKPSKALKQAIR